EGLRRAGWRVELDLRGRRLAANLSHAERAGIAAVAILGEDERAAGEIIWRDLATRAERRFALGALPEGAGRGPRAEGGSVGSATEPPALSFLPSPPDEGSAR